MIKGANTYKDIFENRDKTLKDIRDRLDCLQRSQIYIHNHISKVEKDVNDLKNLILRRLTEAESYDVQTAEVN